MIALELANHILYHVYTHACIYASGFQFVGLVLVNVRDDTIVTCVCVFQLSFAARRLMD